MAAAIEAGTGATVGEQLQQDGVRHAAINDDSLVDALIDSVGHTADLGDHAARDNAGGLVALDLGDLHLGDKGGFIFLIPQQARNISHGDEFFGLERDSDLCGGGVSVDVISLAQVVHAHRCNNGDIAAVQQAGDQRRVHVDDLSHMAQLRVKLGAAEHLAVHAAEADAAAPQLCHEVFVHLTGQHLLDDFHGGVVGDAQAARKVALDAHFFEHLIDGRAAAVYQNHPHAQQGHKMFSGMSNNSIDAKGRVVLPAKFRDELGETFYVAQGFGTPCIQVMSKEVFEHFCSQIMQLPANKAMILQYTFTATAVEVSPNSQGRVQLPQTLRENAKLDSDALVIGLNNRIEIWSKSVFEDYVNSQKDQLADAVGSLSFG